jgi:23S rRNA (cytidine1920-2'-O)/16S rRNA (cytidine1409-2'-O)-methyltransferase
VPRKRLDQLLVERGLAVSREQAQAAVRAGAVRVDGRVAVSPTVVVGEQAALAIEAAPRFVSRGGEKLDHALEVFGLDVRGLVAADLGASTGGFSDCLLQRGAARVYAVDVGYGELAYKLRIDPRVVVMERTNARALAPLPEPIDLVVADLAFISLTKVLPAAIRSLRGDGRLLVLVKPQFEGERAWVEPGGVVRDPLLHAAVLGRLARWLTQQGYRILGLTRSPLLGPAGNREFLMLLAPPAAP